MPRFSTTTRCECQAALSAVLDERCLPLSGEARLRDAVAKAPAHTIGAESDRFDVAWLCPFCGRNTLRSFSAGALRRLPDEPAAPGEKPSEPGNGAGKAGAAA